jgi:dGTPase
MSKAAERLRRRVLVALADTSSIEEATCLWEELYLHRKAARSRGEEATREKPEDRKLDPYRTPFQHDRDRIIHSKAFRRLAHKTQIYIAPEGDHFRTRLSHSLEVAQLARTAARSLRLNEDLAEAIALGHDLGHPPFGHGGEEALQQVLGGRFDHHEQGYLVVTELTIIDRLPLNLTAATRWGIRRSSLARRRRRGEPRVTEEERVVKYADDIAWVNHDIDDAIMAGILSQSDLGVGLLQAVGTDRRERLSRMIERLVETSRSRLSRGSSVAIPSDLQAHLAELRIILEKKVWRHPSVAQRTDLPPKKWI